MTAKRPKKKTDKHPDAGAADKRQLPVYFEQLSNFHCGFQSDLRAIIQTLPLHSEMHVADVGCGDGFYSELLAERIGAKGSVTGFDPNLAFLAKARLKEKKSASAAKRIWTEATLEQAVKAKARFDLVWCAQSLFSFPEPVRALTQLATLLRPGGLICVLENDTLHQCLLPWTTEFELHIRLAEYEALKRESNHPQKFYVGRRLPFLFHEAGLETLHFRTKAIDRRPPLSPALETFIDCYLKDLFERIKPFVTETFLKQAKGHVRELNNSPQFSLSWLNVLIWGRRATEESPRL